MSLTNRLKQSSLSESFVSVVLRIPKMGDNEIPAHFIHEIKTKSYDVIGVTVFLRKKGMHLGRPILLILASLTCLTDTIKEYTTN